MSEPVRIAVAGALGRMGRAVVDATLAAEDLRLVGAADRPGVAAGAGGGGVAGPGLGVALAGDPRDAARDADVLIDFSTASAAAATAAALCERPGLAFVIGATGFTGPEEAVLRAAARTAAIVKSGNMSLGVNLLAGLVRQAAGRLGPDWDIEIIEAHHRRKVDAPSGTALLLAEAAALGRGVKLDEVRLPPRDGHAGPRPEGGIGFAVVRAGGIVGEHEVVFATETEVLRLAHDAADRSIFARGALAAARWVKGKPAGLYSMQDVLGLA
jgi:4-hydroxy-tetrahydrodipicolinate reductase